MSFGAFRISGKPGLIFFKAIDIEVPKPDQITLFIDVDDGAWKYKDDQGKVHELPYKPRSETK